MDRKIDRQKDIQIDERKQIQIQIQIQIEIDINNQILKELAMDIQLYSLPGTEVSTSRGLRPVLAINSGMPWALLPRPEKSMIDRQMDRQGQIRVDNLNTFEEVQELLMDREIEMEEYIDRCSQIERERSINSSNKRKITENAKIIIYRRISINRPNCKNTQKQQQFNLLN